MFLIQIFESQRNHKRRQTAVHLLNDLIPTERCVKWEHSKKRNLLRFLAFVFVPMHVCDLLNPLTYSRVLRLSTEKNHGIKHLMRIICKQHKKTRENVWNYSKRNDWQGKWKEFYKGFLGYIKALKLCGLGCSFFFNLYGITATACWNLKRIMDLWWEIESCCWKYLCV